MKNVSLILSLVAALFLGSSQIVHASVSTSVANTVVTQAMAESSSPENPIHIKKGDELIVSLNGKDVNDRLYHQGSHHGTFWRFNGMEQEDMLTLTSGPRYNVVLPVLKTDSLKEIQKTQTNYLWTFTAQQAGSTTLMFQKYSFSNPSFAQLLEGDPISVYLVVDDIDLTNTPIAVQ